MKCRLAHKKDLPNLKAIWYEVFLEHEPRESIDFYFANNFDLEHTFVLENDDKEIVSTLQLNQHEIMLDLKKTSVSFVVGVATLEKEQRKGYMRLLLDYTIKYAKETLKQE
jgi:predicted acetyltransferase